MKTYIIFFTILFAGYIPSFAQLSLQDSLIAWYPFDGDALDYSGNGNHGTVNGPVLTTDRFGNPNSAYQFDGIDDFIEYLANQNFKPQLPITISAWVLRANASYNPVFFNNFQENLYSGVWLNIPPSGTISAAFGDGGLVSPSSRRTKAGTTSLLQNRWYHLSIIIRNATDMDIFINGKRDCGTYNGTGGLLTYLNTNGSSGHSDGSAQPNTGDFFFKGKMDEIRFYSRELDKSEIRILADFHPQDTTFCQGDSLQLDAGYGTLISWNPSSTLSCTNCSDPIATPIQSTVYTAITENTVGCPDTVDISIITKTCPTAGPCDTVSFNLDFTTQVNGANITIIDQSTIPQNAQMDVRLGDGNNIGLSPGDTISYTYATAGIYTICLEAVLALGETLICSDTLCDTVETISTAIESNTFAQAVMVYPNPATKYLKLEFPKAPGQNTMIKLFNMQGILVQEWKLENQQSHQLDLTQLPKAYYHLNISGSTTFFGSQLILIK
ncbi:MAG: LamG-like jellyroll fold domain-containing protein [Bacteroidia bacterium]